MTAYQHIDQIAEGNADRLTVFELGELEEPSVDQKFADQLKIDFDRDNRAAVTVAFSAAASADGVGHSAPPLTAAPRHLQAIPKCHAWP